MSKTDYHRTPTSALRSLSLIRPFGTSSRLHRYIFKALLMIAVTSLMLVYRNLLTHPIATTHNQSEEVSKLSALKVIPGISSLSRPRPVTLKRQDLVNFTETVNPLYSDNLRASFGNLSLRIASFNTGRILTIPERHFDTSPIKWTAKAQESAEQDTKYFYECPSNSKLDLRYAPEELCDSKEQPKPHLPITAAHIPLVGILKAWSAFTKKKDIVWWIAHGVLAGWFWNAKLLPWDEDLDVQMTLHELLRLIRFNQTMIEGRFLIDVNPNLVVRSSQQQNAIDARVVDTRNG
ncbi:LicD family-domain-containing protein, partial [Obelidium mucronatum]